MRTHRGAFEYDWRARFQLPLAVVGDAMTWGESLRLFVVLRDDPSSAIAAAIADWQYPMSREAQVLADLYDLQHVSKSDRRRRRPKPYPRGSDPKPNRFGTGRYSVAAMRRLLDKHREG